MFNPFIHIFLTIFICHALAQSSEDFLNTKSIYIDPTTNDPLQTGELANPFQNLTQAFQSASSYITARPQNQTFEIIFYTKDGAQIYLAHESAIFKELNSSSPSSIRFEVYQGPNSPSPVTNRSTFSIQNPASYLAFSIPNLKLIIENYDFEFNIQDALPNSELILFEGEDSEVTLMGCTFRKSKVDLKNTSTPLIRFRGGKYLIKESEFTDLDLANPLIELEDTLDSFVKFEMNKFSSIETQGAPLLKSTKAKSFDFMRNEVKKFTGNLVDVTSSNNVIFSENILSNIVGEFPLKFSTSQKLIFENNTIQFESPEAKSHKGLLSLKNFDLLSLTHFNLSGYTGTSSAISAVLEESYKGARSPIVMLENLNLKDNALFGIKDNAISLINLQLKQKANILLEDCEFSGNTLDYTQNDAVGNIGAATVWIEAGNSTIEIKKSILENNKAVRGFSDLYINASDIQVENCSFISNTVLDPSNPSNGPENDLLFTALAWFGDHISFKESTFQENYGDFGGAIGILEINDARIPQDVIIENCDFVKNQAKIGGAIYTNVTSNVLKSIKLAGNYFTDNKADTFSDYNTSPKFSVEESLRLFLELSNKKKKSRYGSGELIVKDVISKQKIGYQLEFYLSDRKNNRKEIAGDYYSSISLINTVNTKEGQAYLVKNFTNLPTASSFLLEQFIVVAPPDSEYTVLFTMKNQANAQEFHKFEFKVKMSPKAISCGKGEFFVPDGKFCKKCPAGTYSPQANTAECLPCPYGGDCGKGGADIETLPGFWRDTAQPDDFVVYPCVNQENCVNDGFGQCAPGYAGPLCEACDSNESGKGFYRPFQLNTCSTCQKLSVWDIIAFVLPLLFLLFTVYMIISSRTRVNSIFSWCLYVNLFVSYMQNIYILTALEFINPPKLIMFLVNLIANPTLPIFGYATCFMQSLVSSDYAKSGFLAIFGAIILVKVLLISLVTIPTLKKGRFFRKVLLAIIWLLYLENPGFLTLSLDVLHCKRAGNTTYSSLFSGLECDSNANISHYVLYPYVLLMTIVLPFVINYSMIRGKMRDNESEEQKKLQVMLMANSTQHITRSNRSWLYFYYVSFGKVALLFLQLSKALSFLNLVIAALYYSLLTVLNRYRVITAFKSSRSRLLIMDAIVPLLCVLIGYTIDILQEGFISTILQGILWIQNGVYVIMFLIHTPLFKEGGEYGELQEEGESRRSSDEKKEEHSRQSIENLDQTH